MVPAGSVAATLNLNNTAANRANFEIAPGTPYDLATNGPLTLSINTPRMLTYAGGLQDGATPFSLQINGGGTLVLSGSGLNTYSGTTRLSSNNLLRAGATNVLSPNSTINNGTVDLAGFDQSVRGLIGSGRIVNSTATPATLTLATPAGPTIAFSGSISGDVAIVKTGAGRHELTGPSSYTGGTTLAGGITAYGDSSAFGTGAITFAGGSLAARGTDLVLANAIVLASDSLINLSAFRTTLAGPITGGAMLTLRSSNGTLALTGTNSYTGGTTLIGGTTLVGSNAAFGAGSSGITATASATIGLDGNVAGDFTVDNAITLATLLRFTLPDAGSTLTLAGPIGGTTGLWLRSGDGVLRLGGDNSYTGVTQLGSGTLAVASDTALGRSYLLAAAPATLRFDAAGLRLGNQISVATGNRLTIDTNGFDATIGGTIRNQASGGAGGGIVKTGAGTLTLGGINLHSGGTRLVAGAISVADDRGLGRAAGALTFAGTAPGGGELIVTGTAFATTTRAIILDGTGGTFNIADAANSFVLDRAITGGGALGKTGAGLLALDVANSHAGGTSLGAGTLRVGHDAALGAGALTITGGTLLAGVDLTLANAVTLAGAGGAIDSGAHQIVLAGPVTGAGRLTKAGTGTLVLAGSGNAFAGGTTLGAGTIAIAAGDALGTGDVAMADGTTLAITAPLTLANGVGLTGIATIATGDNDVTLAAPVTGRGGLVKTGGGALTLDGANRFTGGLRVDGGTVVAGTDAAFGAGTAAFATETTLRGGATGLVLANAITVAGGAIDTQGFDLTLNGGIAGTSFIKNGGGTLILNGANTYTGGTSLAAGTIGLGDDAALGTGSIDLAAGTTLRADAAGLVLANAVSIGGSTIDTQGFDLTIDGDVDGTALTKAGTGTLILSGTNTYTGTPVIEAGTLLIDGTIGSAAIRVAAGATLSGTGIARGTATLADGARLSPGRSPGTLTLGGLVLADTSDVRFELATPDVVGGPDNDLVIVTGDLALDGQLTVLGTPAFGPGVYALFRYGGALTDGGLSVASLPGSIAAQVQTLIPGQVNLIVGAPGTIVQYWDGGDAIGNGAIGGGAGVWGANGTNWTGGAPSQINASWQGGIGVFAAPGGAVSIATPQAFAGLQFTGDGYSLTGAGLIAASAAFIAVDAGMTATIAAPVGGGGIDKQGGGRLILAQANTYAGGTTVGGGTLGIGADAALGTGGLTLAAGTTLQATAAVALANAVALAGGTTIDTQVFALALGGTLSGAGGLTKTGSGTLSLGGANLHGGGTIVIGGTLVAGTATALGGGGLTLGAGTTLRSGAVGLALGNAVALDGATIDTAGLGLTLDGVVGGGALTKTGAGTLRLNGANTYAGGTALTAGTIAVGGDTALGTGALTTSAATTLQAATTAALANAVVLGGATTIDTPGVALTLGGGISGAGGLTKTGAGTLTLGGANSFAGGTTVAAGTLVVGTGTALGTGALALGGGTTLRAGTPGLVVANVVGLTGATTVDTAGALTLGGTVSGTGSLTKTGAGTLTLAAANGYTGGTTIAAGGLTGSAASFGTGAIVNDGALTIAQATDAAFANRVSGSGTLTKTGAGNLTLGAANTLAGATSIAAGRLTVTGSLSPSVVSVASGASLAGTGTIGALVAQAGSLVTPGTVPGMTSTLTVAGGAAFAAGSGFAVDVSPTTADRLTIGGPATLAGTLAINPTGGQYLFGTVYTLVSAASVTGSFAPPVLAGLFGPAFVPTLAYGPTALTLRLVPNSLVALANGLTLTPNQRARATAFDRGVTAGFNPQGFFALFNQGAALPAALNQLTGEVHASTSRVAIEDTRHVRDAALDRLGAALSGLGGARDATTTRASGERVTTLWGRAVGSRNRTEATTAAGGFDHDVKGTILGFDFAKGAWKAGALFHYTHADVDYATLGRANVESTGVGIYAGVRGDGGFAVGVGGSIAAVDLDTTRAITTPGYAQTLRSESGGESRQAFVDVAYDLAAGANARIEPFARVAYVEVRADALRETGGIAALSRPNQSYDATFTTLGLRGAVAAGGRVSLRGSAGWRRVGGDRAPAALLTLAGTTSAASIAGVALDRDAFAGEAGADIGFGRRATFGIGYTGVVGGNNRDHGARATLTIGF